MNNPQIEENLDRRSFLVKLTTGLLGLGAAITAWPVVRSLVPNVYYEPPRRFKIGVPHNFQEGVTFLESQRIFLFREGGAFHAISAECTHLGCTVKFTPSRQTSVKEVRSVKYTSRGEFNCPCHGSKFHDEGTNYAGPAPKPLAWYALELSPADGQLIVNKSQEVDRHFRLVV